MLEVGQAVPHFSLKDQHGQDVSLNDARGSRNVVLVFYPFAFSGVCTGELCEIRDHLVDFSNDSTVLLAVSCDHMFSLRAFAEQERLPFALLSDFWPHGQVLRPTGFSTNGSDVQVARPSSSTARGRFGGRWRTRFHRPETSMTTAKSLLNSTERSPCVKVWPRTPEFVGFAGFGWCEGVQLK